MKSWWDGVKKHVNEALNRHRNNVIKSLKQYLKVRNVHFASEAVTFRRGLPDFLHRIIYDKLEARVDGTKNGTSSHGTNLQCFSTSL